MWLINQSPLRRITCFWKVQPDQCCRTFSELSAAGIHLVWTWENLPTQPWNVGKNHPEGYCGLPSNVWRCEIEGHHWLILQTKEQGRGSHVFTLISQHSKRSKVQPSGPLTLVWTTEVDSVWTNHEELALNNRNKEKLKWVTNTF